MTDITVNYNEWSRLCDNNCKQFVNCIVHTYPLHKRRPKLLLIYFRCFILKYFLSFAGLVLHLFIQYSNVSLECNDFLNVNVLIVKQWVTLWCWMFLLPSILLLVAAFIGHNGVHSFTMQCNATAVLAFKSLCLHHTHALGQNKRT